MSSLEPREKGKWEDLLQMSGGYVSNFSDATMGQFFYEHGNIDIHSTKYQRQGTSKAKKLREFWTVEPDAVVGPVLVALAEYTEEHTYQPDADKIAACRQIAQRLLGVRPNLKDIKAVAIKHDAAYLAQQIKRMEDAVVIDPHLAIGTAKELIETICRTILTERGKPVTGVPDIAQLTKVTLKELKLVPEGVREAARGADVVKRILQNLGAIGNGLAELRGLYGTGHGDHSKAKGLRPRHAKLAVGAAATLATFLFDTHMETKP